MSMNICTHICILGFQGGRCLLFMIPSLIPDYFYLLSLGNPFTKPWYNEVREVGCWYNEVREVGCTSGKGVVSSEPQRESRFLACRAGREQQGGLIGLCSDLAPITTVGARMPSPVSTTPLWGDIYLLPREKSLHREQMARFRKL